VALSTQANSERVSVVIVNYRSWDKLAACIDSLSAIQPLNIDVEIVIVDNQSNDGQFHEFSSRYPHVQWIENTGNNGFAHGCNTGAQYAKGEYLLFLNPDTEVHENIFNPLVGCLNDLPSFSIVATQKRSETGKAERVARFFPRWYTLTGLGKALHRKLHKQAITERFKPDHKMVFPDWVSGSVVFIRRQDWLELKGWDERFWMYSEDVDLCKRATKEGGKVALLQNIAVVHNHGGSSRINPITSALTKSEVYISRHVYISQHFAKPTLALVQCVLGIKSWLKTGLISLLSLLAFNHPKAQVSRRLFANLTQYYIHAIKNKTWLSPRSILYKNKLDAD
jgi:GT2 family glycosyltransferase